MMADRWNELPQERREALELGNAAMAGLKRGDSIERWHEVGIALNALQEEAMAAANTNQPIGKRYNHEWLDLSKHVPHLRDVDTASRSHAMWLAREWQAVDKWRMQLPVNIRLQLSHPTSIRRRYDTAHKAPSGKEANPAVSPQRALKDKVIQLQEENDLLRKRGGGGLMPSAPVEELAALIAEAHNVAYRRRLIAVMTKDLEADARQDRIERDAQAKAAKRKPARPTPQDALPDATAEPMS